MKLYMLKILRRIAKSLKRIEDKIELSDVYNGRKLFSQTNIVQAEFKQ